MGLGAGLPALDPLPQVQQGPGYRTWTLEADLPLLKLEDVMMWLRMDDQRNYEQALQNLGIQKVQTGPLLAWPRLVQPMETVTEFLSSDRRKMAVLTAPVDGHHQWYAVLLRQEGNGEAYWRARQVFVFDTDPVVGYQQSFPDVLGEDLRFWQVYQLADSDIYGRLRVSSLFRYDEIGRLRLTFQEVSPRLARGQVHRPGPAPEADPGLQGKPAHRAQAHPGPGSLDEARGVGALRPA